jgi:hypothetical protein
LPILAQDELRADAPEFRPRSADKERGGGAKGDDAKPRRENGLRKEKDAPADRAQVRILCLPKKTPSIMACVQNFCCRHGD